MFMRPTGIVSRLLVPISTLPLLRCSFTTRESKRTYSIMTTPAPVVVPAKKTHTATVIFLHGLGDTGHGWSDIFKYEIREDNIKYICPSSESRPVTKFGGAVMPAWFSSREDVESVAEAVRLVHGMIDAEVATGMPANRIVLGGFSMGAALAVLAGMTYSQTLAGVVALSGFALQLKQLPGTHTANRETNVFVGHGTADSVVPLDGSREIEHILKNFNPNVKLHVYDGMGHSSCPQELRDVKAFISDKLS